MSLARPRALHATCDLQASGSSVVEALVATFVLVVGLTAAAQLLAVATAMNADARQATASTHYARLKLAELTGLPFRHAAPGPGGTGSLDFDVPDYFDLPAPGVTRRWTVGSGPVPGTHVIRVRVFNRAARHLGAQVDLATVTRQW